ncbi:hypothetical protein AA23498_3586 [Acetobacter nitrogenifigens DSM 23921 = NBRC 105050]|uniref:Uncharacterized protein n=1 Tax=Acetobacter nitrogenifigens DSM 23921 = NBRC 105050 TaxID=1120919 RepID=A0A511XE73_9PROT|nr:hypothetical protein [Acetobacter nitrogenifigens]GBQ99894.1 hypothetical protein AA23498_3586 [Acetobacter nitrogenifigens DSM 23921 = NBRC 105050]GEN61185.1 hypothetical protein ANI02nite_30690 [Acetobacter nitrogenifigens DSM 23921 = NBRC 105050]
MKEALLAIAVALLVTVFCARYRIELAQAWMKRETRILQRRFARLRRVEAYTARKLNR